MSRVPLVRTLSAVTLTGVALWLGVLLCLGPGRVPRVSASVPGLFADTDGDLLPDVLEWVLLTKPGSRDSDGDGIDDFLEAVQHIGPLSKAPRVMPLDHEMRVFVATVQDANGAKHVLLNVLMRIVGGIEQVNAFHPYLAFRNAVVPVESLVTSGLVHVAMRHDPEHGTYVLICSRIGSENSVRGLLPFVAGATGTIGTKHLRTGTYLLEVDGAPSAVVPVDESRFVLQTLSPFQDPKNPFWKGNHTCVLRLQVRGHSGGSVLTEVEQARCDGAPTLRCAPSCLLMNGKILVIPGGLDQLRGL